MHASPNESLRGRPLLEQGRSNPRRDSSALQRRHGLGRRHRLGSRGSVLVIVMVSLLFATFAVLAFMEKASVDLLVEQREAVTRRLRSEAYSALEVTLGVLTDFSEVTNGLHSPAEGWSDPLGFAGYVPSDGRTIEITFEDESGKIPLPRATAQTLTLLFQNWGIAKQDAEQLADAMLGWMKRNHIYTTAVNPNYDMAAVPYDVPGRSLRSYHELRAIDKAREIFYDRDGRPNDLWLRFVGSVSLLDFQRPNINGAKPDTLAALGQFDEIQQQNIGAYLSGTGNHQATGPGYFQSPNDALRVAGSTGDAGAFSATISALRINVTVRAGQTEYRVSTVISPPNGATPVQTTATETRTQTSSATSTRTPSPSANSTSGGQGPNAQAAKARQTPSNRATATAPNQANANERNLKYPFTLLEIYENDEIPSVQPSGSPVTGGD